VAEAYFWDPGSGPKVASGVVLTSDDGDNTIFVVEYCKNCDVKNDVKFCEMKRLTIS
jgi:hypothetical protein